MSEIGEWVLPVKEWMSFIQDSDSEMIKEHHGNGHDDTVKRDHINRRTSDNSIK